MIPGLKTLSRIPFTVWVVVFAASGYFVPQVYDWSWREWEPKHSIGPLVQVIMFGMGVSLTFTDFARVLKMPKAVVIGIGCQYTVMPMLAWLFATVFGLRSDVAAGLVLIGSCPGGVASNVIAYIARANVPLSVTMTACSTLLSPLMTPLAMMLIAGQYVAIDTVALAFSILKMVLIPVLLGLLANQFAPRLVSRIVRLFPPIAMLAICLIVAITIALAREESMTVGVTLFAAAACHNAAGYLIGHTAARWLGLTQRDCRTVALEVGIQNGGMATGLAINVLKNPVIALGAAVFGPWSAMTSSMLASQWQKQAEPTTDSNVSPSD